MSIEDLRKLLDKFIDTSKLTNYEVLIIYEQEMLKGETYLHLRGWKYWEWSITKEYQAIPGNKTYHKTIFENTKI